ncbi:MAG: hypothetical protein QW734_11365, partial [Candidatus Bathyarchaeia archaeon]
VSGGELGLHNGVLKLATWGNIEVNYDYMDGFKIRVDSRERYFLVSSCSYASWSSGHKAKTVLREDTCLETYSNWVPP